MKKKTIADYPEDRSGCGLERVAEITGKSYGEVREAWLTHCNGDLQDLSAVGNGAGLRVYDVLKLLDVFGRNIPVVVVQGPAILLLIDRHNSGHYVRLTKEGRIEGMNSAG